MSKEAEVYSMIDKAAAADKADDALRFSQAAVNAADALQKLAYTRALRAGPTKPPADRG